MKKNKIKRFPFLLVFTVCIVSAFAFLMATTNSNITNLIATDPNTEFNITYDLKDGKFEENITAPTKYKYIEETSIPNPVKEGSEFLGWTINDKEGEPVKDYKIPKGTSGDIKLTANWKVLQVKLMSGQIFNDTIKRMSDFYNVTKIQFVKGTPNQSGTDVSEAQDRSIMASIEGDVLTVASENTIYANENSANTFFGAEYYYIESYIESIDLSNFDTSNVTDMESMFYGCNSLTSIKGLENFDTSQVTNMSQMFYDCAKIRTLNVSNFDTSNVANMSDMFSMCDLLSDIKGLENFNTSQVTTMESMFYGCDSLTSLNLSNWNTSNVIRAGSMFSFCSGLRTIDLSNWKTSNLKVIASMFDKCKNLETIKGLNNFDTSNVTHFSGMFEECNKLSASMTIANPNVSSQYGYGEMFLNCSTVSPAKFVLNYTDNNTKTVAQNMVATKGSGNVVLGGMPSTLVDGSTFNSTIKGMSGFANVTEIRFEQKSGTLSGTDISEAKDGSIKARISGKILYVEANGEIFANKDCSSMFYYCESLTNLDLRNFDTSKVTDMSYMFYWCRLLTSLDLSGFDTSKVTYMNNMFRYCEKLTSLDLTSFDTSKVTDIKYMFSGCNKLSGSITIMNPNVTSYSGMFNNYCSTDPNAKFIVKYVDEATKKVATEMVATKSSNSNVYLDGTQPATFMAGTQFRTTLKEMSGFENVTEIRFVKGTPNTNGVNVAIEGEAKAHIEGSILTIASKGEIFANKDCSWMFSDLKKLNKIIFDNFDTSNVIDMTRMFDVCNSLTSLDLSNFNTSNVTNMSFMFVSCNSLTSLDLSNFNTSNVTNMSSMFAGCNSLTSLDLSNFDTSRVDMMSYMFENDNLLTNIKGLENFDTSRVYYIAGLFNGCSKLSGQITIMNADIPSVYIMFKNCSTDPNAKFIVKYVDEATKKVATEMVATKSTNSNVYLDGTQPATLMSGGQFNSTIKKMNGFSNVTEIRFIKGTPNPNGTNVAIEGEAKAYIEGNVLTVASKKTIFANEDCDRMFYDCSSLTSIDVSNFDTSKVTTMYKMFNYCEKLTSIDVSNFNTSKVTNMWGMFSECYSLTSIKGLENFNTSQVTSMNNMFSSCRSLTSLDASNFDTSQVTIMYYMFNSCRSLTSIKGLENFDTSKVTNMSNMFNSCGKLSGEITISNPNITEYSYMFTNSSTDSSAKFVVNYTSGCQSVAKAMVATKDSGSTVGNVVLGTQKSLLSEDTPNDEEPSVPDTIVLTIKDGNKSTIKEILVGEIGSLNTPSKEGMVFSGYFYDIEFTKPVLEKDIISEDTTIYIKWEEVPQVEEIPQEENKDESLEVA